MVSKRPLTFLISKGDAPARVEKLEQEIIKIGKLTSCHLCLEDDEVSRMHAVIEATGDKVEIIDLGSRAGTIVNGKKVSKRKLRPGDEILLGNTHIVFDPEPVEAAPPTTPACPRCRQQLVPRTESTVTAQVCPRCGSLWLDPWRAAQVTDIHGVARALRALADDAARRAPFGGATGQFNVACPFCGLTMERMAHQRSGVVVDLCQQHGTWFDRGELQRVVDLPHTSRDGGPFRSSPPASDPAVPLPVYSPPASWAKPASTSTLVEKLLDLLWDSDG